MIEKTLLNEWLNALQAAVDTGNLVKLALNKPTPAAGDLKSIDIRPIMVKRELKLSFTYHHQTRDVVKNYTPVESATQLSDLLMEKFTSARLYTLNADLHLSEKAAGFEMVRHAPSQSQLPELAHDRAKHRLLESADRPYLRALGITDAQGKVCKNSHDKFRQINKYIEILDGLIRQLPIRECLRIVDMGAGKGYLTFALYDYVTNSLKLKTQITGVEFRADLVRQSNDIAKAAGFDGLDFVQGSIADYDCTGADAVIALHACDTATDDAIFKAITAGSALIVVAPCCHKQIRGGMDKNAGKPLEFLMKYGTYVERIAEMVTDGMRSQLLELSGYRTNLFEFISDAHTPKNVMIVATKSEATLKPNEYEKLHAVFTATKAQFGIGAFRLEQLLGLAKT